MNYLDMYLIFTCAVMARVFVSVISLTPTCIPLNIVLIIMCIGEFGVIMYVYYTVGIGHACMVSTVLSSVLLIEMVYHD